MRARTSLAAPPSEPPSPTDDLVDERSTTEKLVDKLAGILPRSKSTRRSFLTRTAVVGSALAVSPLDFMLKPASAYDVVCGSGNTCGEGWSVFCCTINGGFNSCPPGSFTGGWWKADNSAFCGGFARYYIDCNQSCSSPCGCFCPTGTCDNRRTCCNQFRYGQCNQQIGCAGPVRCRIVTCTPPWQFDGSCTTASATDNRTGDHNAPCNYAAPPPPPPPPPPPGALASVSNVAVNQDGRLEVFAVAANGSVNHTYQIAVNSSWAPWESIGGTFPTGTKLSVGRNQDGRLEVFGLAADNRIWHNYQIAPNNPWAGFSEVSLPGFTQPPTVGRNPDGRLEIFAVNNSAQIAHAWQNLPNNPFSAFESLGGSFFSPPAVGRNLDGRLEVFCVGADNALWHAYQQGVGQGFSLLESLGGSFAHVRPAIAANANGRLTVILVGADSQLYSVTQLAPNGSWGGISGIGGFVGQPPAVGRNLDGRLEIFAIGLFDHILYHAWQMSPGGAWSAFDPLGGSFDHPPAVVNNADGRLEVFCISTDKAMWHQWQVAPNSSWGEQQSLGGNWT